MFKASLPNGLRAAELTPPVSKSDAMRALILGDLLGVPVHLPPEPPEDVSIVSAALTQLSGPEETVEIDARDGGAPFRFLTAFACACPGKCISINAHERLRNRPHEPLFNALARFGESAGIELQYQQWPIRVDTRRARYPSEICMSVRPSSSQYPSALLLMLAALQSREEIRRGSLTFSGEAVSRAYLEMTVSWLRIAGFMVELEQRRAVIEDFSAADHLPEVPLDWSSVAYLVPWAWRSGGAIAVSPEADHADKLLLELLADAGLKTKLREGKLEVSGELRSGFRLDAARAPDLAPALATLAAIAPGPSLIENVSTLRVKESDRVSFITDLAKSLNVKYNLEKERLLIHGRPSLVEEITVSSADDHRRVMASAGLLPLGCRAVLLDAVTPVAKSFPAFWSETARCGLALEETA